MNRQQRRAKGGDRAGERVDMAEALEVRGCGEVTIDGASWPVVFGGAYLLAAPGLELPPGMMPRIPAAGLLIARVWLTSEPTPHIEPTTAARLHDIDMAMRAASGKPATGADPVLAGYLREAIVEHGPLEGFAVDIGGHPFDWKYVPAALAFMRREHALRIGFVSVDGETGLRLDGPAARFVLRPLADWHGPRLALLNREQMDAMQNSGGDA